MCIPFLFIIMPTGHFVPFTKCASQVCGNEKVPLQYFASYTFKREGGKLVLLGEQWRLKRPNNEEVKAISARSEALEVLYFLTLCQFLTIVNHNF